LIWNADSKFGFSIVPRTVSSIPETAVGPELMRRQPDPEHPGGLSAGQLEKRVESNRAGEPKNAIIFLTLAP